MKDQARKIAAAACPEIRQNITGIVNARQIGPDAYTVTGNGYRVAVQNGRAVWVLPPAGTWTGDPSR